MDATTRGETHDPLYAHPYREGGDIEINERVEDHKDRVDAPIVGTMSVKHLEQAVEALDIDLSDSDLEYLEEPYEPVEVTTHE